jgi:hypothetical protein
MDGQQDAQGIANETTHWRTGTRGITQSTR